MLSDEDAVTSIMKGIIFKQVKQNERILTDKSFINADQNLGFKHLLHMSIRKIQGTVNFISTKTMDSIFKCNGFEQNITKAIENGQLESVKFLIENNFVDANAIINDNESLLFYSLKMGKYDIYDYLLSRNAHMNFVPISQKPFDFDDNLFSACMKGKLSSVQWLIEREGVDKNMKSNHDELINCSPIHVATQSGSLSIVDYLIQVQKVDPNIKMGDDKTPLHIACIHDHFPIIEYLMSKGASLSMKDRYANTPLHYACEKGHIETVKFLISKQEINLDIKGDHGKTPLQCACEKDNLEVADFLISKGATMLHFVPIVSNPCNYDMSTDSKDLFMACKYGFISKVMYLCEKENVNVMIKDSKGNYPIHIASEYGFVSIIQYFIEKRKVDPNIVGNKNKTPLHYAAENGHIQIIEWLIKHGANKEALDDDNETPLLSATHKDQSIIVKYLIEQQNVKKDVVGKYGTPFQISCIDNKVHVLEYFIESGSKMNSFSITNKPDLFYSDIFEACQFGQFSSVQWIIEKVSEEHIGDRNNNDETPLHIAASYNQLSISHYLIENNAEKDAKDNNGRTPLHHACKKGYFDIIKYLISIGADAYAKDKNGSTPLHYAVNYGHITIVKYFVERLKMKIDIRESDLSTPLHHACLHGFTSIASYLIELGANINAKDINKDTPLHKAALFGQAETVKSLIEFGADIKAKNNEGKTPYDTAANKDIKQIFSTFH